MKRNDIEPTPCCIADEDKNSKSYKMIKDINYKIAELLEMNPDYNDFSLSTDTLEMTDYKLAYSINNKIVDGNEKSLQKIEELIARRPQTIEELIAERELDLNIN